ncbi:MAG: hypothetical protein E7318_02920 [Clostridiales bacterium]|nr:hypothetical protein [Clostridiales bacterium]
MKKKLIIWGIIIAALLVYFVGLPYINLRQADQLFNNGQYAEAYEKYEELRSSFFFDDDVEYNQRLCQINMAEEALSAKDYERAIELYTKLGKKDKVREIQILQADDLAQQGEYKQAAELYEKLQEAEKAKEAWAAHGEKCLTEKKFAEAISIFEKLNQTDRIIEIRLAWAEELLRTGHEAELPSVLKGLTGEQIAQYHFDAVKATAARDTSRSAAQIAGEYGAGIADINTQLAFCNLLKQAEIDLAEVYPNGVVVDVDLSQYQMIESLIYQNLVAEEPVLDYSKILVFSREESKPQTKYNSVTSEAEVDIAWEGASAAKKEKDYGYTVRLQPGLMNSFLDSMLASTLEECTSIILLEKGYYPDNCLQIKSTSTYGNYSAFLSDYFGGVTTYTPYISHYAYEGIIIYSVSNPLEMLYYDCYVNSSLMANAVVGNSYSDSDIGLNAEEINEIMAALENREDPASAAVLEKYPKETVDFVDFHGWGNYLYIPEVDANGNPIGQSYSTEEADKWSTEKYMLGVYEEGWMNAQLADGAMSTLGIYLLFSALQ